MDSIALDFAVTGSRQSFRVTLAFFFLAWDKREPGRKRKKALRVDEKVKQPHSPFDLKLFRLRCRQARR